MGKSRAALSLLCHWLFYHDTLIPRVLICVNVRYADISISCQKITTNFTFKFITLLYYRITRNQELKAKSSTYQHYGVAAEG